MLLCTRAHKILLQQKEKLRTVHPILLYNTKKFINFFMVLYYTKKKSSFYGISPKKKKNHKKKVKSFPI